MAATLRRGDSCRGCNAETDVLAGTLVHGLSDIIWLSSSIIEDYNYARKEKILRN